MGQALPEYSEYIEDASKSRFDTPRTKQYTMTVLFNITIPAGVDPAKLTIELPKSAVTVMDGADPIVGATVDGYETTYVDEFGDAD